MDLQQLIDCIEAGNLYLGSELDVAGVIAETLGGQRKTVNMLNDRGERVHLYLYALIVRRLEADRLRRDGVFCKECCEYHETNACPFSGKDVE